MVSCISPALCSSRYAKSRSDAQLAGSKQVFDDLDDCDPVRYPGDLQDDTANQPSGNNISNIYAPCGLIAWSMFNDSFAVYVTDQSQTCSTSDDSACSAPICVGYLMALPVPSDVPVNQSCTSNGIAWDSDVDKKFKTPYDGYIVSTAGNPSYYFNETPGGSREGHVLPIQTDPDFMVWMRIASLPTFRKLYRIFPEYSGFTAGTRIWIRITNRFPVSSFGGTKAVILSTTSWIGGKNYFLGIAYVVVGCLCFLLGIVFTVKHVLFGRSNSGNDNFGGHKPN